MNSIDSCKYAFVFSGAGMSNLEDIFEIIQNSTLESIIKHYSYLAKSETGIDVWNMIARKRYRPSENELTDQIISYTLNCSIANYYKELGINPQMLCGYSMGVYSALKCGGAIDFNIGLNIVQNAFYFMENSLMGKTGAMASVIGLRRGELEEVIGNTSTTASVEIANESSEYNMVVTGLFNDVRAVMQASADYGALKVIEIKVALPYHHSYLMAEAADNFSNYLKKIKIDDLSILIVSSIDQDILRSSDDIRAELYKNIKMNMSWHKSVRKIASTGIDCFVETGGGNYLQKIGKSIDRAYKTYSIKDILGGCHELRLEQRV